MHRIGRLDIFALVWLLRVLRLPWFCAILCMYPVLATWKRNFMCILDRLKLYLMGFGVGLFSFTTPITPFVGLFALNFILLFL